MKTLPKRAKIESVKDYLIKIQDMGFLFHGSGNPEKIKKLEPRQTNDPHSKWNNDNAVFASSKAVWSTIFAVYKGKKSWSTSTRLSGDKYEITARIPKEYADSIKKWSGYVYVLSRKGFEQDSQNFVQFKTHNSVEPLGTVKVTVQDYLDMGGTIEWVD